MGSTLISTTSLSNQMDMSTIRLHLPLSNISSQSDNHTETNNAVTQGILNDALYDILNNVITQVTLPIIEVCGIVANSINLVVFWSIGLNDTVTSSFFALSLSDMCYLLAAIFVWLCFTLGRFLDIQEVRLSHLSYLGIWYCHMFLAISILITTYIAIQRCCCVALPLKFKGVFTSKRNSVVIVLICIASASMYIPIISHQGMRYYVDISTNSTWYGLWFSKNRKTILVVTDFLAGTLFPTVTQVMTVICMIILTSNLRKSSRFRQGAMSTGKEANSEVKASGKEIQVVKAVTVVTLMFIFSNVPPICIALTRRFIPTFDIYKAYTNLFSITNVIKDAIQYLNASLNIVVYYNFNSSYRSALYSTVLSKVGISRKILS